MRDHSDHFDHLSDVRRAVGSRARENTPCLILKEDRPSAMAQRYHPANPDRDICGQSWSRLEKMSNSPKRS